MRHVRLIYRGPEGPEELEIELDLPRVAITRGGSTERGELTRLPDGRISALFESGRQVCGRVRAAGPGEVELSSGSANRRIALAEPLQDRLAHTAAGESGEAEDEQIHALMPGRVVEVAVAEGDHVEAGGLLLVLEAMKMQNEIRSARGGVVVRVSAEAGKVVEGGTLLAVLRPAVG